MAEAEQTAEAAVGKPTAAGIYDFYLGGTSHTTLEREAADRLRAGVPEVPAMAWANRAFHQRAVRWLADHGVRQFIDLGSGLPTQENTHQVAQAVAPESRVLYVDHDQHTAELGDELVGGNDNAAFLHADLRKPDEVLDSKERRALIDLDQPVAVVATAVIHFISDEADPWAVVAGYVDAVPSGSYLVLSHCTSEKQSREKAQTLLAVFRATNEMIYTRDRAQCEWFFDGLELVPPYEGSEPTMTFLGLWGCEDPVEADDDTSRWVYCGVARKP